VTEAYIPEFDLALLELKLLGIWLFKYLGLLLKHVEEIFDIHLRLCDFSKQCSHVEEWTGQLHKISLYQYKITRSHCAVNDGVCGHTQINCETSRIDDSLSYVEFR